MPQELCPRCGAMHEMRVTGVTRSVTGDDGQKKLIRTDSHHCTRCGQFVSSQDVELPVDGKAVS